MRPYIVLILFLFSVLIGCAPDLIPYYIALFNRQSVTVLTSPFVTEVPCRKETESSICNAAYLVDLAPFKHNKDWNSLGAGQVIYATQYTCVNTGQKIAHFDDIQKPGKLFDIFNLYQTIEINEDCKKILIEAWGPKTAVRRGQIGGRFVIGTALAVQHVKRWSEFFCREVYQAFVFCLILLSLISAKLRESVSGLKKDEIDESIFFWIICAVSSVGLIQLIVPIFSFPQLTNEVGTVFILTSFALPFILRLEDKIFNIRIKFITLLISSVLMSQSGFQKIFLFSVSSIALFGLLIAFKRKSLLLFTLAVVEGMSALKILGVRPMPNAMTAYFFVGLIAFYKLGIRVKITSNFSKLVSFVSKMDVSPCQASHNIREVVEVARELISLPFFTILSVQDNSSIKITQHGHERGELFVDGTPPVFAHAMSIRKEVWHLKVGSPEFIRMIKTCKSDQNMSGYVSIIPIYDEEKMYGALAISGYSHSIPFVHELDVEQKAILRMVAETLRSLIKKEQSFNKSVWNDLFFNANEAIARIPYVALDSEYPLGQLALQISRTFQASVFIAELNSITRTFSMKGISGFHPAVQERFEKGTIYANLENEQGPVALAVNRKQTVIISEVKLLKDVLHENSVQFFDANNTRSCAGLPIFRPNSDEVWGILWLERNNERIPFDLLSEAPLNSLAGVVSMYIDRQAKEQGIEIANAVLKTFIPSEVFEEVINHGLMKEEDRGYLLMLDLKGSTRISLAKGSDFWLGEVSKVKKPLTELGEKFGFKLREYKWDAFVFSCSSDKVKKSDIDSIVLFCKEASILIETWYEKSFKSVSQQVRETGQKARFCTTFGDISRGLIEGTVKTWGMIGTEIAAVTKMEDYCKKLSGIVFFDESVFIPEFEDFLIDCETIVESTQRRIFTIDGSWSKLIQSIDDAA